MTMVIFQGSINEVSRKLMTNKAANDILKFIKATNVFTVGNVTLQFIDSLLVVPSNCEEYNEIHILAEEVVAND